MLKKYGWMEIVKKRKKKTKIISGTSTQAVFTDDHILNVLMTYSLLV